MEWDGRHHRERTTRGWSTTSSLRENSTNMGRERRDAVCLDSEGQRQFSRHRDSLCSMVLNEVHAKRRVPLLSRKAAVSMFVPLRVGFFSCVDVGESFRSHVLLFVPLEGVRVRCWTSDHAVGASRPFFTCVGSAFLAVDLCCRCFRFGVLWACVLGIPPVLRCVGLYWCGFARSVRADLGHCSFGCKPFLLVQTPCIVLFVCCVPTRLQGLLHVVLDKGTESLAKSTCAWRLGDGQCLLRPTCEKEPVRNTPQVGKF